MKKIEKGSKLKCIFDACLPGKDVRPPLVLGDYYTCEDIIIDSKGNEHIDAGIPLPEEVNFVTSYATGEVVSKTKHLCHPNRFIVID